MLVLFCSSTWTHRSPAASSCGWVDEQLGVAAGGTGRAGCLPHKQARLTTHMSLRLPHPSSLHPPCSVHQGQGVALNPPYAMEQMQCYIKYARAIKPRITTQVA